MSSPPANDVTKLLLAWGAGDSAALDRLIPLVHGELHRIARLQMGKERVGHTLQPSALVNEAFLRIVDASQVQWQNRAHFYAVSAQLMRHILVDFARSRRNQKRGGDQQRVSMADVLGVEERGTDLVALDDALKALADLNRRQAQVVELRFFGGLSIEETAEILKVSIDTVKRDWRLAKVWLLRELGGRDDS